MPTEANSNIELVFVDESGGTDLSTKEDAAPDFYVIAGIYFSETDLSHYSSVAENIVKKHAGSGELKSSNLGSNTARRTTVLNDIAQNRFPIYCLVVNKEKIYRDSGLRFRPSFYKFLHNMFYSQIGGTFLGVRVQADQYGRSEFMDSFKQYIDDLGGLFNSFEFAPSSKIPLLQLADVVAGSVRRVYLQDDPLELLKVLGYPSIPIEEWPPTSSKGEVSDATTVFDAAITTIALDAARNYVEDHLSNDNEDDRVRAQAIRYLLFRFEQNPGEYVRRSEITAHIQNTTSISISEPTLSTKVFADARDSDVIVVSTDKGVKIPYGAHDLQAWMERTESQVAPYLRRVEAVRQRILLASHNRLDIANPVIFPELSRYLGNRL